LRYQQAGPESIQAPKAYLSKTITNLCLDQLKSSAAQREMYVGPWLPEPLPTAETMEGDTRQLESISMAFLVVLEQLSPQERAVFLLREVFDYEYEEIADILGKSEATCRQLFHRAKTQIAEHRPRFRANPERHKQIFGQFLTALNTGDMDGLLHLLAEDVTSYADGGGKTRAATHPVQGRDKVARFLLGINRFSRPDMVFSLETLNGVPSLVVRANGKAELALLLDVEDDLVQAVRLVVNPDKLARL